MSTRRSSCFNLKLSKYNKYFAQTQPPTMYTWLIYNDVVWPNKFTLYYIQGTSKKIVVNVNSKN